MRRNLREELAAARRRLASETEASELPDTLDVLRCVGLELPELPEPEPGPVPTETGPAHEEEAAWRTLTTLLETAGDPTLSEVREVRPRPGASDTMSVAVATVEPAAERVGRFSLGFELGRGGMGRVVEATDPDLSRTIAIKLLLNPDGVPRDRLARFVTEARITSRLEHPNIPPVHELGLSPDGRVYYTMRKVDGVSLEVVLKGLRMELPEITARFTRHRLLTGFVQVCQALAFAHQQGVLHRDLKPANVMLGRFGEVLVMDWGLARVRRGTEADVELSEHSSIDTAPVGETQDGTTLGTPGWMSPEQAKGRIRELDERSDIWSLGAILYSILTWRPPYEAPSTLELMWKAAHEPPPDPRSAAPERKVPEEVAEICLRAMAVEPADRFPTAKDLSDAVEAFLDGSRRRARARERLAEGRALLERWREHTARTEEAVRAAERLGEEVPTWAGLEDKQPLLALRERVERLQREEVELFGDVVGAGERALSHDPDDPEVRGFLAGVWWDRLLDAERRRDAVQQARFRRRLAIFDDGTFGRLLSAPGRLRLRSDPPGAEVLVQRFEKRGLLWPLLEPRPLGATPLDVELPAGSYLLTLRAPGRLPTRYPVESRRGETWEAEEPPVRLLRPEERPEGFLFVPGGPFESGGDPVSVDSTPASRVTTEDLLIAEFPVTCGEYAEFLTALSRLDPGEAEARAPRREAWARKQGNTYWPPPAKGAPWTVPEVDADGDRWQPDFPVFAISWYDAQAYVAWRRDLTGLPLRLPREVEWEKAARGVDGRWLPWGDEPDPALAKIRPSRRGRPQPEPVGAFPTDRSVYGVRDMAGGVRDWCGESDYDGVSEFRPVRGGSWLSALSQARPGNRFGVEAAMVHPWIGFRLACDLPRGEE